MVNDFFNKNGLKKLHAKAIAFFLKGMFGEKADYSSEEQEKALKMALLEDHYHFQESQIRLCRDFGGIYGGHHSSDDYSKVREALDAENQALISKSFKSYVDFLNAYEFRERVEREY